MKTKKPVRVLLVNSFSMPASRQYSDGPEISVTVAVTDESGQTPRNWTLPYSSDRFATDCGGCSARLVAPMSAAFPNDPPMLITEGPRVTHTNDPDQYEHALRALKTISKRLSAMYDSRGSTVDSTDALGRWIEATGCTSVFVRPEGGRDTGNWLSEGDWDQISVGTFLSRVRALIKKNAPAAEIAA